MTTATLGLREHLSYTQIKLWLKCQRQHWYRYGLGIKEPPSGAMVLGSAVHAALEHQGRHKAQTGRDVPPDELSDVFADRFHALEPDADWKGDRPADVKDRGHGALIRYREEIAPRIRPASADDVERRLSAPLLEGCAMRSIVDLITDDGLIVDYKVSGKAVNTLPGDTQLQLGLYWASLAAVQPDRPPAGVQAHYLIAKKPAPAPTIFDAGQPDPREVDWWLRAFDSIRRSMIDAYDRQEFLPASPGSWVCSPKWCAYWERCRRDW